VRTKPALRAHLSILAISAATTVWTTPSVADECSSDPHACAVALFDSGRKLLASGDWAAAIPVFKRSLELQPTIGSLLNLGDCYVQGGAPWDAYVQYRTAVRLAQVTNDARLEAAETSAKGVEPRVLRVKLVGSEPGGIVRIDSAVVSSEYVVLLLAGEYALVPGRMHTVEVTSSSGAHRTGEVEGPAGALREIIVHDRPALQRLTGLSATSPPGGAPAGDAAAPAPSSDERSVSPGRTAGIVLTGVGAAGLVVGAVTGLVALGDANHVRNLCAANGGSYPGSCGGSPSEVRGANDAANVTALASTITFVVGGIVTGVGVTLYVLSRNATVGVAPTPGGAAVSFRSGW
jgi:hypothetical protein